MRSKTDSARALRPARRVCGLTLWHATMHLVESVQAASEAFPRSEDYALTGMIRQSAYAIPTCLANSADGPGFRSGLDRTADHLRDLATHIQVAAHVGYLDAPAVAELGVQIEGLSAMVDELRGAFAQPDRLAA